MYHWESQIIKHKNRFEWMKDLIGGIVTIILIAGILLILG